MFRHGSSPVFPDLLLLPAHPPSPALFPLPEEAAPGSTFFRRNLKKES